MSRTRHASIARQFLVAGIVFALTVVAAIAAVSIRTDEGFLRSQMDLRGQSMARYMARTAVFYYRNFDLGALDGFVKDITGDPEVAYAVFYDDKGKALTTSSAAPASLEGLLGYQQEVRDETGAVLGRVSLGYRTTFLVESRQRMLAIMGVSGVLAAIIAALGIAFMVRRLIVRPMDGAIGAANRLASGDLTVRFASMRGDEIGRLLAALERMREGLAGEVGAIRRSAENVGAASSRIERGTNDMSARTEELAATLEQAASSMEELTTTVKSNAENAGAANELAIGASRVAGQGGEAMSRVIATMDEIAGASRKIGEIIAVIDGIAFQTNILALNAAVEAARAGEQGRGFAVVAAEVRSLAQRSAEAARQIKGLIQDSTGRVDGGMQLVERAGKTMQDILDAVKSVTDIMGEIAQASREQLAGIEQVANAVTQMDRATQQNASRVEDSARAARDMASQSDTLVQAVSRFSLDEGLEGVNRAAAALQELEVDGLDSASNAAIPTSIDTTKRIALGEPVASATSAGPGQNPASPQPTPKIAAPTSSR